MGKTMEGAKKALTKRALKEAYARCVERERFRRMHRSTSRQGSFERDFLSLDAVPCGDEDHPNEWESDGEAGVGRMLDAIDGPEGRTRAQSINWAKQVVLRKCPRCLPVFWLVIRNETDRRESVWQLARTMKRGNKVAQNAYYRQVEVLARTLEEARNRATVNSSKKSR